MKALSIRQPWAWRILHAGKDIENRDWRTSFRGRVLIHAGVKLDERPDPGEPLDMPRGGIVGAVTIVDCVAASSSKWFCGDYGFVLADPVACELIPCKGKLGFFEVPPEVKAAVMRLGR